MTSAAHQTHTSTDRWIGWATNERQRQGRLDGRSIGRSPSPAGPVTDPTRRRPAAAAVHQCTPLAVDVADEGLLMLGCRRGAPIGDLFLYGSMHRSSSKGSRHALVHRWPSRVVVAAAGRGSRESGTPRETATRACTVLVAIGNAAVTGECLQRTYKIPCRCFFFTTPVHVRNTVKDHK